MFNCHHGMMKHHSGTGPTHHHAHLFGHARSVAMHRAQPARTLLLTEAAMVEPSVGISEQLLTVGAQLAAAMMMPAIEAHHHLYPPFLFLHSRCPHSPMRLHRPTGQPPPQAATNRITHQKFNVTFFPKGASTSPAILKCWRAKGRPTMVMASRSPKNTCTSHAQKPPNIIQRRLRGMRRQPGGQVPGSTRDPKGHRHSSPSLNVCMARGMPMMVTASARVPLK